MRIKRVEIIGFKSFCDRAVVQIGESITGVVGPNGCGKSNIVDAIRWCMGEQSAKHLRGKAMEDVIFAGSETRGPAPMAEVSLTFDDVGFSHEVLELARHSDEAETERALDQLAPEAPEPPEAAEPGDAPEVGAAGDAGAAAAAAAVSAEPGAPATPADAPPGGEAPAPQATGVWVDAEGNPIASPLEEAAEVLADRPPAINFGHYTEVTITRRLYRDGTSQYFINKTPCRLRDITDFFLGTGVGTKAYAIIEQGRIGQIVSSRPQDRRAIIEEAAGITKFKAKKKAAEKKLDQTRQNLMRVSDIVTELDKRMGTLRRQAQKAERYRKYKAEMRDIELWKAAHRWLELAAEDQLVTGRLTAARGELDEARAAWSARDAHVVAERAELSIEERRLVGVQEQLYELDNRIRLGDSKIGFERREAEELDGRIAAARTEIEDIAGRRARGAEELAARRAELAELEAEVAREADEVCTRDAAAGEARQMLANAQGQLDQARTELATRRTEIATSDAQLEALVRRRDEASRRLDRVLAETVQQADRVRELEREGRRVDGALAQLRQTRLDLGSQGESFAARKDVLTDEVARGEAEVETLRTELHRRNSRLTSLREIQDRYEGFQRGTRAVMQRADEIVDPRSDTAAIHGVVADVVRAPELLEVAVEAALGDRLGGVLVSEPEVGLAAIGFLKQRSGGRSAFVPLGGPLTRAPASEPGPRRSPERRPASVSAAVGPAAPAVGAGGTGRADDADEIDVAPAAAAPAPEALAPEMSTGEARPADDAAHDAADDAAHDADVVWADAPPRAAQTARPDGEPAAASMGPAGPADGADGMDAAWAAPASAAMASTGEAGRADDSDVAWTDGELPAAFTVEVRPADLAAPTGGPDAEAREASEPEALASSGAVEPETTVLPADAPEADAPEADAPEASAPEASAPDTDEPASDGVPRAIGHGVIEVEDRTQLVAAYAAIGGEGVLGRMADLVGFADGYESVGKRLLGATVVVDDLSRALQLHRLGVTDRLVTLEGDVVEGDGIVAGGSRDAQGAGVLAQKREIRDLEEIVGRLEHDLSEATARLVTAKTELKQVSKALDGVRTQVHEGEVAIMGHEKDDARIRHDLERHRDRLGQLAVEQHELDDRLRAITGDETATRDRRSSAEQRIAELERAQLDHLSAVAAHRDRLDELGQVLTEAKIRAAQLGEKRAAAEASALRLAAMDGDLAVRAGRLTAEIDDAVRRALVLRDGCAQLTAELAVLRDERTAHATALDDGRRGYDARLAALTEVELAARELRIRADGLAREVGQLELRAGQIQMTRQVVDDHIQERYQLEVRAILHDYHLRTQVTQIEDDRLAELRELIDRMGTDINLTAIEEYAEVNQRFEFLSAQKTDLERAVDQLQRAIDKINKTSRKLFRDTFTAVNTTFKEVFPRLFRGGQAALSLAGGDEVDLLDAGVEIMAQPPGKKNATVEQLSGGEKALTAVALVFSIFLIKPSPFCILDEVDAPLDEANVDRYNELVREMTDRSQFIVITHNKRTMEAADNLYGVTMQEPGVSKLVSVNLSKLGSRPAGAAVGAAVTG
jgi:chromosome segregation protein